MKAIQMYKHLTTNNILGVADKIKKEKKGNYNRTQRRKGKR